MDSIQRSAAAESNLSEMFKLKLSKPYIPKETTELIQQVLRSGNLVQGENVSLFENKLAEYLGIENVILVSSGTAALHISLIALGISEGDEVIVPAYSFPAVANVVELVGATPVFVDISLDDFCIDVSKVEAMITAKTRAIIPVHEFGQAADIQNLMEIARKRNLHIIEDAACAIGTKFNDQSVGSFSDLGCFSFHPRKMLTTGEGGAITTNNKSLANKIRVLRNHGIQLKNEKYDFVLPGFNYRMTDFQAAIGLAQLPELNDTISFHRSQALFYKSELKNIHEITFDVNYNNRFQTYQTFHILIDPKIDRDFVKKELLKSGIESNIGAYAIPVLSYYKNKYNPDFNEFENAMSAYNQGLALPIGRHLNEENLYYIINTIKSILTNGF